MAIILKQLLKKYIVVRNLNLVNRNIMTSSSRLTEKVVEELKTNPYFEKYATKIATLQKTSPEEFLSRVEAAEKAKAKPKFGGIKERY